ncbi:hypothetical protein AC249_AIPGENE11480 [Exaiptasia diaphana]|nr:hypothetical protein AC249_AIPGENE11480 [Exaiptasia diaphana]
MADELYPKRAAAVFCLLEITNESIPKKKKKKKWVRPWIARREERGCFHQLVPEHQLEDENGYRQYFRINKRQFSYIANIIYGLVCKEDKKFKKKYQAG